MGMTQTVEESIDVYDWFLDMYGRKRHVAEVEQGEKRGLEKGKKFGLEEGKKLGLEEGEKLGFEKGKREDVLNMLKKKKYSLDEISEITGLSEEEILQIAKDNNLV